MAGTKNSGRKRLPTAIKELKGTLQNCRENKQAPKPGRASSFDPPAHLDEIAAAEYVSKAELLDRLGVFKEGDSMALAAYADAYSRWVRAVRIVNRDGLLIESKGQQVRNPVLTGLNNAVEQMYRFLTEFGLTPASRSKIKVDDKPKKNEWELFTDGNAPTVTASVQ